MKLPWNLIIEVAVLLAGVEFVRVSFYAVA